MARLLVSFTSLTEAGTIFVAGPKAGDRVLSVVNSAGMTMSLISPVVIADGELLQFSAASGATCYALIEREVMLS